MTCLDLTLVRCVGMIWFTVSMSCWSFHFLSQCLIINNMSMFSTEWLLRLLIFYTSDDTGSGQSFGKLYLRVFSEKWFLCQKMLRAVKILYYSFVSAGSKQICAHLKYRTWWDSPPFWWGMWPMVVLKKRQAQRDSCSRDCEYLYDVDDEFEIVWCFSLLYFIETFQNTWTNLCRQFDHTTFFFFWYKHAPN